MATRHSHDSSTVQDERLVSIVPMRLSAAFARGRRAVLVAAALMPLVGCEDRAAAVVSQGSPSASVRDLQGMSVDALELAAGGPLLLTFLAIDCPIANAIAPRLESLRDRYSPQGVLFLDVYADPADEPDAIRQHRQRVGLRARALLDPSHVLVQRTGVRVTPEVALFTAEGELAYRGSVDDQRGALGQRRPAPTRSDLERALEAVLEGRQPEVTRTRAVGCLLADAVPAEGEGAR